MMVSYFQIHIFHLMKNSMKGNIFLNLMFYLIKIYSKIFRLPSAFPTRIMVEIQK